MSGCALRPGVADGDDRTCRAPAIYRAWVDPCACCAMFPQCTGHPVCIEHGAALRVEHFKEKGHTVTLLRICSLNADEVLTP